MADKTWEQMSSDEKIEDLRKDIKKLFEATNTTNGGLAVVNNTAIGNSQKLALMIDKINDRLTAASIP